MSFNFSFSVGYLIPTDALAGDGTVIPAPSSAGKKISDKIKVNLYPRWYKHVVVDWTIPADWGNCIFNVYFGSTSDGPFTKLNPTPIQGNHLSDTSTQEYSKFNKGYYVVEAILIDKGNHHIRSLPQTWDTYQNKWVELRSEEIQRREWFLLSKFTGVKSYVFRKMNYGERCPECWDSTISKVVKDNCKTCMGTSFKGGYFPCYTTYLQYDPSANSKLKTYFGVFEPNQVPAWTIKMPVINPDDIIVRSGEWDLYRVENLAVTQLQGNTVRQMLQLTELDKHSIEFELLTKNIPDFPSQYT